MGRRRAACGFAIGKALRFAIAFAIFCHPSLQRAAAPRRLVGQADRWGSFAGGGAPTDQLALSPHAMRVAFRGVWFDLAKYGLRVPEWTLLDHDAARCFAQWERHLCGLQFKVDDLAEVDGQRAGEILALTK